MDEATRTKPAPDLREILAADRTFLAWIRTGLSLMGFGFVVARFGIFLREIQVARLVALVPPYDVSLWFGTALITLGVIVNLLSAWKHILLARQLDRGEAVPSRPNTLAISIAMFLALVGLAMGIYLISISGSARSHSESSGAVSMAPAIAGTTRCNNG
jgi:putative membrane protein